MAASEEEGQAGPSSGLISSLRPEQLAGQLTLIGFDSVEAPPEVTALLARGECGGCVLFRRNFAPDDGRLTRARQLCEALARACPSALPPLLCIDEEGGRVARLPATGLTVPPMRRLARGGPALVRKVARFVGAQLRAVGLTMNFAPVVDVDTNPENPIIGDRAFGSDPDAVVALAREYCGGLTEGGLLHCLKHFPGHGDTHLDSHLSLPTVDHAEERLRRIELSPFVQLAAQADSIMTAHVVFSALDAERPATLSPRLLGGVLRGELGYDGLVFTDDMEMKALAGFGPLGQVAVRAIEAGCDSALVCSRASDQAEVREALRVEIERDAEFRARAERALRRSLRLRYRCRPAPDEGALQRLLDAELEPLRDQLEAAGLS